MNSSNPVIQEIFIKHSAIEGSTTETSLEFVPPLERKDLAVMLGITCVEQPLEKPEECLDRDGVLRVLKYVIENKDYISGKDRGLEIAQTMAEELSKSRHETVLRCEVASETVEDDKKRAIASRRMLFIVSGAYTGKAIDEVDAETAEKAYRNIRTVLQDCADNRFTPGERIVIPKALDVIDAWIEGRDFRQFVQSSRDPIEALKTVRSFVITTLGRKISLGELLGNPSKLPNEAGKQIARAVGKNKANKGEIVPRKPEEKCRVFLVRTFGENIIAKYTDEQVLAIIQKLPDCIEANIALINKQSQHYIDSHLDKLVMVSQGKTDEEIAVAFGVKAVGIKYSIGALSSHIRKISPEGKLKLIQDAAKLATAS
jgi:hypothetical protein